MSDAIRKLMTHSALDSHEMQELKRLWWSLENTRRVFPMFTEFEEAQTIVESLVYALKYGRKALVAHDTSDVDKA